MKITIIIFLIILPTYITFSFSGKGSGTQSDPYQITNVHELQEVNDQQVESYWILMNDIDASETRYWNLAWPDGDTTKPMVPTGFRPIFFEDSGTFDGNGHIIKNLYENMVDYGGLFYKITGTIKNLGIVDCEITGYYAGGFCYRIDDGFIYNSFITGKVIGEVAGGICAGGNIAVLNQCYSECNVIGKSEASSFTGVNDLCNSGLCFIKECYSVGEARGGFVHNVFGDYNNLDTNDPINNCYWNTETTGAKSGGGNSIGRTTSEMMQDSTYHGFDKSVWCFNNGKDYPKLKIFNNCYTDIITKPINSESEDIKIYPNPSNGQIQIEFTLKNPGKINLKLINELGTSVKQIYSGQFLDSGVFNNVIDLDLTNGAYLLVLTVNDSKPVVKTLVIIK